LPKERPRIVPPPASFQKMVDELGLHPVLQPECPKLFKDGLFQKCPLASSVPPAVASRRRKLPRPAGLRNWFLRGNGRASPRRSACLGWQHVSGKSCNFLLRARVQKKLLRCWISAWRRRRHTAATSCANSGFTVWASWCYAVRNHIVQIVEPVLEDLSRSGEQTGIVSSIGTQCHSAA